MSAPSKCPDCRADLTEDSDEICTCPDDVFWARLLGGDDPCAPGRDWPAAAFGSLAVGATR
jgi:hypothetical protein